MNNKLIKHIVVTKIRWRSKFLGRAFMMSTGLIQMLLLVGADEDLSFLFIIFGLVIPLTYTFTSSILAPATQQINQLSQSGSFSWKYLHTVVHDRKSFIVGYCLAGVACTGPILLSSLGAVLITKIPIYIFFGVLIPFFLLVGFLRLLTITNVIQFPRSTYYKYNNDEGFIAWIKSVLLGLHKFSHFGSLFFAFFLIVSLAGGFGIEYAFIAGSISILILIKLAYEHTLLIWADERFSQWIFKRESKKTSVYVLAILVFGFMNMHFHGRIYEDDEEVFEYIADSKIEDIKKMDLNKKILSYEDDSNRTPLHFAIFKNKKEIVELLIEKGANLEHKLDGSFKKYKKYLKGMTPLLYAIDLNRTDIVDLLIKKGSKIDAQNVDGLSSLSFASFRCNLDVMEKLVKTGADINQRSGKGYTPLFYATQGTGCLTSILYLKKLSADESLKNDKGQTYLEYAKEQNPVFYNEVNFFKTKI
jgi:ankyrin repeat protein